jgi:uncharacterized protein YodC (DUF2158 family)
MEFKVGDVVQLKSGGPNMTISGFYNQNENSMTCTWFCSCEIRISNFPPEALIKIEK